LPCWPPSSSAHFTSDLILAARRDEVAVAIVRGAAAQLIQLASRSEADEGRGRCSALRAQGLRCSRNSAVQRRCCRHGASATYRIYAKAGSLRSLP
jgi:hypothetical protein